MPTTISEFPGDPEVELRENNRTNQIHDGTGDSDDDRRVFFYTGLLQNEIDADAIDNSGEHGHANDDHLNSTHDRLRSTDM